MKDVDTALVVAAGLIGLGLYGLSAGRSRSDDLSRQIQKLDQRFHEHFDHSAKMRLVLHGQIATAEEETDKKIKELEERLASRVLELEKRAGIPVEEIAR